MDVENNTSPTGRRRRTWPAVVAATGVLGAATLTFTLLSPLGSSSADASELTAFDDCDALAQHMSGLAIDRILDSRRAYEDYYDGRGDDEAAAAGDGMDLSAPLPRPESAPRAVPGTAAGTTASDAGTGTAAAAPAATAAKSGSDASAAVGNAASGTNTQEAGVDEADLAKTDGRLLVTTRDRRLVVMDVSGDTTPRARGSVVLPGQRALELLLAGDRAIVVGTADARQRYLDDESSGGRSRSELTTLSVVDLSDPDRPRLVSTEEISARYLSARMTGDTVRLVFSSTPDVLGTLERGRYHGGPSRFDDEFVDEARARLARIPGEDWLPMRRNVDRDARTVAEAPLLDCSDVRYPVTDSGMDLLTVLSIDTGLADGLDQAAATGLIGSGELVYATQDKLFVATTDGGWVDRGGGMDAWMNGNVRRDGRVSTRVHSFDITGTEVEYLASGRVDGYLYGRWAMSESDGLLRMVTTTTAPWNRGGTTETGVVVLDTAEGRMREIGRVDGMGLTETVRSVRWFDDVAVIVTFRQTDPLYLVDLSRPESPKVRGELKIPGFSSYLHPVGDHRLLGIGQDANSWGGTLGLQVSSFDILDLADPQRTDNLTFGRGSTSPVERDPRGFVYLPGDGLAVLPIFNNYASRCPKNAKCADSLAPADGSRDGLVAVQVAKDGTLREVASWYSPEGRRVVKLIPLADGRLIGLDHRGIRLFDAGTLAELGSAYYG